MILDVYINKRINRSLTDEYFCQVMQNITS